MAIAAMLIAACGDDDAGAPEDSGWQVEVEAVGCDQVASNTGVDPADAALFVAEGQELYLDAGGGARIILVTKECDDFVVDGESFGPGHMDTLWVRVPGPTEGVSFPDDPELEGPTPDAFVPQFIQTDNAGYSDAVAAYGVPLLLAEEMDADPPGIDERTGGATNSTLSPPLSYRWTLTGTRPSGGGGLVNHLLRGTDVEGRPIRYAIECSYYDAGGGSGVVEFEPGGPFETLLGDGWNGSVFEMKIDCQIVIEPS